MGCQTMQNVFNADDNHVPFFSSILRPEVRMGFHIAHSEAHVPGRHLNALLEAEAALGLHLDPQAIELHRSAMMLSYSGPVALPLNRQIIGGAPVNFCPHNLREGFHALYALAKYRRDQEALELAERSIKTVLKLWNPENGWDAARLEALGLHYLPCQSPVHGETRMMGPLVKLYRDTGLRPALELAQLIQEQILDNIFTDNGAFDPELFGTTHVHSITCVMSSLAQLADVMGDQLLMARVKAFYDQGLWQLRDAIGWTPEIIGQQNSDHGEANNTGDILETALILGRWGHPECYHDAERILRCHLLPSQLRDSSFIIEPPNPTGADGMHDVARRHLGAFGLPTPYGHESISSGRGNLCFNMDIVGGAVGSLCEAYREIAEFGEDGCRINLLFDYESPQIKVQSAYTHDGLSIELAESGPLFVRLPPWVEHHDLTIEGSVPPPVWNLDYLYFKSVPAKQTITLRYPLKESSLILSEKLHLNPIRAKLRGDTIKCMDNFGADLTYFDPYTD